MDEEEKSSSRGGDPLSAMYFLAAVLMFVLSIGIAALTFLPSDFARSESEDLFIPAVRTPQAEADSATRAAEAQAEAEAEELHMH